MSKNPRLDAVKELCRRVAAGEGSDPEVVDLACRLIGATEYAVANTGKHEHLAQPWFRLLRIWERVVTYGAPMGGNDAKFREWFSAIMPSLIARKPKDPYRFFERVVKVYLEDRRAVDKDVVLRFFIEDFDVFAERALRPELRAVNDNSPDRQGTEAWRRERQAAEERLRERMLTPEEATGLMAEVRSIVKHKGTSA